MYSEMQRTVTSLVAPVYFSMEGSAAEMMLEPKLAARASMPSWNVTQALYGVDQLRGLAASFSSQPTRNSSGFSLFVSTFTDSGFSSSTSTSIAVLAMVSSFQRPRMHRHCQEDSQCLRQAAGTPRRRAGGWTAIIYEYGPAAGIADLTTVLSLQIWSGVRSGNAGPR